MLSFGSSVSDATANALCSLLPIGMSLRMKNRTQNVFMVAGTASILYALPDVPASAADFTRSDELPEFFCAVSMAKSRVQSPGLALTL